MCGISGFAGFEEEGLLEAMTAALAHRGPDDTGYHRGPSVGLGHRRLSIIDVAGGHQPMVSEDGALFLIANGEIYNYRELRAELVAKGHRFATQSDNETILHLYEEHGEACVARLFGMFAFAIWNARERTLFLARDRLGIKPLYYAQIGGRILFASESKAILRYAGFEPKVDPAAVHRYLALRYVPGPGGMFEGLRKLPAGHHATWHDGRLRVARYWEPVLHVDPEGRSERVPDEEWIEGFGERFETSIRRRLISEVPLGAYLSGGLDSSTIVAAIARETHHPVRTFTVGFDYQHDELGHAAETARALGCEHTEIACRASDVELLPKLVHHLDEPLGDPIVIPMYQLAKAAKEKVTVVLTGEGADEVLGGYLFHEALLSGRRMARLVPGAVRRGVAAPVLGAVPAGWLDRLFRYPAALGERGKQKLVDLLGLLDADRIPQAYLHLITLFDERDTADLYADAFRASLPAGLEHPAGLADAWRGLDPRASELDRILHLSFEHWLPDDILMKQDKMSMASAIEARVPFLDHELVEYALTMPPRMKIRGGVNKLVLRRYAARLLPEAVTQRGKMPFYNPIEHALGEPVFKELVDDALSERAVRERGLFRPAAVRDLLAASRSGEFVHVKQVFSLVVLELWFRTAVDRRGVYP